MLFLFSVLILPPSISPLARFLEHLDIPFPDSWDGLASTCRDGSAVSPHPQGGAKAQIMVGQVKMNKSRVRIRETRSQTLGAKIRQKQITGKRRKLNLSSCLPHSFVFEALAQIVLFIILL